MTLKRRRIVLTFPTAHGATVDLLKNQKILDGMNIRFDIKINGPVNIPAECYCDVYNLNRDDIQFLTTSASTWLSNGTLMQLYAGYDENIHKIFSGVIMNAVPEGNPDVVVQIRAISNAEYMASNISFAKNDIKMFDLLQYASDQMGFQLNCPKWMQDSNVFLNKSVESFSFTGSSFDLLKKIQDMSSGFDPDGNGIMLTSYNSEINVFDVKENSGEDNLLINKYSGMIGYPKLTAVGCNVKILLNTNLVVGQWVRIESERIPISNGNYCIIGIRHNGELRGNDFYTTLECSRNGLGV